MKKLLLSAFALVLLSLPAWAARVDKASLEKWAKSAPVPGYTFSGVDETDPGVFMAAWTNAKEEAIGLHVHPASAFKTFNQVVNKKKPVALTYKGQAALYSDALAPMGSMAVNFEAAGKVISLNNMGQPRALTQDEMIKILDGMGIEKLFK